MILNKIVFGSILALGLSSVATAAQFNFKIHTLVRSPHPYNDMAHYMEKQLEKRSDGRIAVKVFEAGQLGQDPEVMVGMALGTIDIMISTTSNAATAVPEYSVFSMPYLLSDLKDVVNIIGPGTPVQKHFQKVYNERGTHMRLLALGASGTRNLSSIKEVHSVADLKGLRMRVPPSPMVANSWAQLGVIPTTIDWGELYAALQTGVVSAMESSLPGYSGAKLYEVAPNLILTQHQLQINHISISAITWKRLPDDLQKLVQQVAAEANKYGVKRAIHYDNTLIDELQDEHDVNVIHVDTDKFHAKVAPIQKQLAEEVGVLPEYELIVQQKERIE